MAKTLFCLFSFYYLLFFYVTSSLGHVVKGHCMWALQFSDLFAL